MPRIVWFIARRLVTMALLMVVVSFLVFSLLYLAPGDPLDALLGNSPRTAAATAALRAQYHLDDPFLAQYWRWIRHAAVGDFGRSITSNRSVASTVAQHFVVTGLLGAYAFVLAVVIGVPLAIVAAVKKRTALDRAAVGISIVGVSAPAFVTGIVLLYVFGVELDWFPIYGSGSGFLDRIRHLTLPAFALSFTVLGLVVKFTRAALITALDQDYVAFALARGVPARRVLVRYGLRNALVPVVTALGLVLMAVLTGSVLVESTFSLSGLGALLVQSVNSKDIPVIQAVALFVAAVVVGVSLLVDLLYLAIDPRIRTGAAPR